MADGRVVDVTGVYREVTRPSKLVFTWFADYNRRETLIMVTFRPQGTGTVMSFRQQGFTTLEMRDRYGGGWGGANGSFDQLARRLADPAAATR